MSGDDPALRAGDADRDAAAERLRTAHAEGRLTVEEFDERLDAAFAARTIGDLVALTSDLPAARGPLARTGDEAEVEEHAGGGGGQRAVWGVWASAVLVNLAVWLAVSISAGGAVYFWPIWVAGPWGAVLLARTLFGPGQHGQDGQHG